MSTLPARRRGLHFALASALLMGTTPIFGKQAIEAGVPPLGVVAIRTGASAALLLLVLAAFRRRALYIYPLGLAGCLLAGGLNGLGSLFFYSGLARLDAGLAQLLFSLYPVFVAVLLYLDGQRHTPLTLLRLGLSLPAIVLLTRATSGGVDLQPALYLLLAGMLYALHIPINERILYEAPAPTVTFYTLVAMAVVVIPAYALASPRMGPLNAVGTLSLAGLTAVTFLSRLTLFAGVKHAGGMQASLLGLAELLMAVGLAHVWLHENLAPGQWIGAGLLVLALLLTGKDSGLRLSRRGRGWLHWLRPPLPAESHRPLDPPSALAQTSASR
ncbi:MAG: DMT family transporter [Chloroflexota bacterium]